MPSLRSSTVNPESEKRTTRATRNNHSANTDTYLQENEMDDEGGPQDNEDLVDEGDADVGDAEDEDEDEEEEAETRCLCEQLDPPDENGLFIQCEKCQVWQHGYCVGITDIVPEKYWCERCKPELHMITVTSEGRTSSYIPVQSKSFQKTSRRKNRKTTKEKEEELEAQAVKKRKERATYNSREDARYEALIQRVMEESKKDATQGSGDEEKQDFNSSSRSSRGSRTSRRRRNGGDDDEHDDHDSHGLDDHTGDDIKDDSLQEDDIKNEYSNEDEIQKSIRSLEGNQTDNDHNDSTRREDHRPSSKSKTSGSDSNETSSKPKKSRTTQKSKTKKPTSSSSTSSSKSKADSTIDFNKPTKPRLPQTRTTVNEMRKRIAAILEFIGRTQIEIANEQNDKNEMLKYVEDEKSKSNIEQLFENYNGSLELMDALTRKLLVWEQKFGKLGEK